METALSRKQSEGQKRPSEAHSMDERPGVRISFCAHGKRLPDIPGILGILGIFSQSRENTGLFASPLRGYFWGYFRGRGFHAQDTNACALRRSIGEPLQRTDGATSVCRPEGRHPGSTYEARNRSVARCTHDSERNTFV